MKTYFVLASKNLRRRKLRSWLTLIGIFVGIAAVVSLISLGNTLKETVNSQFDIGSLDILTIQPGGIAWAGPTGISASKPLTEEDIKAIERIGSVQYALPRNVRTMKVEFNQEVSFLGITSLPNDKKMNHIYNELDLKIKEGRILKEGERDRILIGSNIADGKRNGFNKDLKIGNKIFINNQEFRITGIFEQKGNFRTDGLVLMNELDLKELNNFTNEVDSIIVRVKEIGLMDYTKEEIERLLRQRRNVKIGEEDFQISTPESTLKMVNQILMGVQIFIIIIASISIFVGAIGISNTMLTSVLERRKEIGTMKAIGARNKDIFYQFLVEAGCFGFIGGLIGLFLGIGLSYVGTYGLNNYLGINTKPSISFFLLIFSLTGSFLIGAISGIIPAMRAAKQNPVEAIRS